MKIEDVLKLEVLYSDLGNKGITIKEYLKTLLLTLWAERESFSGKRPFGNSGWEYDLYIPLIKAGAISGELDEDDCINEVDEIAAAKVISRAIKAL